MLARIRKAQEENEGGFTLIELLVVMIIIGILAAIAIPVFLAQREKGWDSAVKSDLKNAATAQETYLTDIGTYYDAAITPTTAAADLPGFKFSAVSNYTASPQSIAVLTYNSGALTTAVADGSAAFCMTAVSKAGNTWVYDSRSGGLQPSSVTSCAPATP